MLNSGNSRMHDIVAFQENMSLPRVKGVKFKVHDIIINSNKYNHNNGPKMMWKEIAGEDCENFNMAVCDK